MAVIKSGVLKAILYADIFDFPLTKEELSAFAVEEKLGGIKNVDEALTLLKESVSTKGHFFFLKGREEIVTTRLRRKRSSEKKLALAKTLSSYMTLIPTVLFVGVTGGVAAENAEAGDDIDFIIITKTRTMWTTRLILLILLHLLGRRRVKNAKVVCDMACLNLFLDASMLQLPENMRSLYTAHEIVQMHPLFSRGNTYEVFLKKNEWIEAYLPQAKKKIADYQYVSKAMQTNVITQFLSHPAMLQLSKFLQNIYMGSKRKQSYVSDLMLGFYPQDYHSTILTLFDERVKRISKR